MQKDDNCIFKINQDRWEMSYLSKHLSCVKRSQLLASPVKLIFCGLSPFYKIGEKHKITINKSKWRAFIIPVHTTLCIYAGTKV
jgi:hypothetical protein